MKNAQGQDTDCLDIDLILIMLMDEYKNQRAHFQKDLQRNFIRIMQAPTAQVELDHFIDIVNSSVTPEVEDHMKMMHPFMAFPGKVSRIRAYIYSAVASEKNTVEVQEQMFLAACNRYGLETPVPTVHTPASFTVTPQTSCATSPRLRRSSTRPKAPTTA